MAITPSDAKSPTDKPHARVKQTQRLNLTMTQYLALIATLPHRNQADQHKAMPPQRPLTLSRWVR